MVLLQCLGASMSAADEKGETLGTHQVIPHFGLGQLFEAGRNEAFSLRRSRLERPLPSADDANLNRLFSHLAFEAFFEREESGVNGVFERDVVIVPA